jgi:hypothetical protein
LKHRIVQVERQLVEPKTHKQLQHIKEIKVQTFLASSASLSTSIMVDPREGIRSPMCVSSSLTAVLDIV